MPQPQTAIVFTVTDWTADSGVRNITAQRSPGSNKMITMVKKRLADGQPCKKCAEIEAMLRRRGLWDAIDEVVWAEETDPSSVGMVLARRFGVDQAPFFVVDGGGEPVVYTSALKLIKERLKGAGAGPSAARRPESAADTPSDFSRTLPGLAEATPQDIIASALTRFGPRCAIAFSGAEDVVLIDMAAKTGAGFDVFCLDTGRLHPETYTFIEQVRKHYGIAVTLMSPDAEQLQAFVRGKGLFSFYEDGHSECCGIRKVAPLKRALADRPAWITGQRQDQSPATRALIPVVQMNPLAPLATDETVPRWKYNPLARWTSADVWSYIRAEKVPFNPLHELGFRSIGCQPCTRPVHPGQHEREGRWWWEDATKKECGLHLGQVKEE